jgi:hypothetical protein
MNLKMILRGVIDCQCFMLSFDLAENSMLITNEAKMIRFCFVFEYEPNALEELKCALI